MKLTLDVENTVTKRDGKMHLDPFEPDNTLVMVGMLTDQGLCLTFPFDHADRPNQDDYYDDEVGVVRGWTECLDAWAPLCDKKAEAK